MIWLTWRQFRAQTLVTAGALAVLALYLVYLGNASRHSYDTTIVGCTADACRTAADAFRNDFSGPFMILGTALVAVPAIIGVFWGAPLVTRELEERTDRLVWNQSITRTRWLAVKLGLIALATVVTTGLFSLLLTWSASRYDQLIGDRFAAMTFDARNLVPAAYGLFAFVLGTVTGMVVRRSLPAMAITLAVFAVVQLVVPLAVRQHLMPPVTTTLTLDAEAMGRFDGIGANDDGVFLQGYAIPGGWSLTEQSKLYNADGTPYTLQNDSSCAGAGSREASEECLVAKNLHFEYTYQPGSRYWPFQWIELGLFLALSVLLTGFGFWWLRRRV
jgi:ABC-type transport system involved in multi-copper enzyme maturation permease subunit